MLVDIPLNPGIVGDECRWKSFIWGSFFPLMLLTSEICFAINELNKLMNVVDASEKLCDNTIVY